MPSRDIAVPAKCEMCRGAGYVMLTSVTRPPPPFGTYSIAFTWWIQPVRCHACWTAGFERLKWLRDSKAAA